jgi:hypothetical protein
VPSLDIIYVSSWFLRGSSKIQFLRSVPHLPSEAIADHDAAELRCKQALPAISQRTGATDERGRRNEERRKSDVSGERRKK